MKPLVRTSAQTVSILLLAALLGLAFNANRPAPLLLRPQPEAAHIPPQAPDQPSEAAAQITNQTSTSLPPSSGQDSEQEQTSGQRPEQVVEPAPGQVAAQSAGHLPDQAPDQLDQAGIRDISVQDAAALFQNGQAVFLDARDAESYAAGHVQGALHLPLEAVQSRFAQIAPLLEGRTVIAYCDGAMCRLSHDLAELCAALGLSGVRVLQNGWTLWQDAQLPTTTGEQP